MNCEHCGEVMFLDYYTDHDGIVVLDWRCPGCGHCEHAVTGQERYTWLLEQVKKPLPNYQDVIRAAYIEALKQVKEDPAIKPLQEPS